MVGTGRLFFLDANVNRGVEIVDLRPNVFASRYDPRASDHKCVQTQGGFHAML